MKSTIAITSIIFTFGLVSLPLVWGDNDYEWGEHNNVSASIDTTDYPLYKEECGSCHIAYPPALLPSRSWNKMMRELENHFGDNAELDDKTHQTINQFLNTNSADNVFSRISGKFSREIKSTETPQRISDTAYFKDEHNEIPLYMVTANDKVNSFSQCNACHTKAEQGLFDEDDVTIPGFKKWDD